MVISFEGVLKLSRSKGGFDGHFANRLGDYENHLAFV